MMLKPFRVCAALLAVFFAAAAPAFGQDYPTRPVRVLVGASPEATPRLLAEFLQRELGQPFVVEPRPGAGGDIAAKAAATADPDGYTLLYASSNYTLASAMQLGSVDFATAFTPIGLVGQSAYVLVAHPDVPAKTVPELIALVKAKPGELNCGSSGIATPGHLSCEMFKAMVGAKIVHVPYRNASASMNGLVSGQVQFSFSVSTAARGQIEAGAIRGLAVTTEKKSPLLPELPVLQDFGLPGFIVRGWGSLVAPVGTPQPIIDKLNVALMKALADPGIQQKLLNSGLQPAQLHKPEWFGNFIREEIARWNRTIDLAGVPRGKPQSN
ncbi:MAG TPA: tripartite tricarboxylate transporter substrate-binding protein [Xanthobacteraceae bacterium]|nr:tripartite tricarboxylate transporter substrate-binding protein [Xanthobacteraceae bacterium]